MESTMCLDGGADYSATAHPLLFFQPAMILANRKQQSVAQERK